ncbi:hypothetical protein M5689_000900 [Euphorbia peplus]|nr:hypothetical protein M5689_000900 [Euphorbia peplus]
MSVMIIKYHASPSRFSYVGHYQKRSTHSTLAPASSLWFHLPTISSSQSPIHELPPIFFLDFSNKGGVDVCLLFFEALPRINPVDGRTLASHVIVVTRRLCYLLHWAYRVFARRSLGSDVASSMIVLPVDHRDQLICLCLQVPQVKLIFESVFEMLLHLMGVPRHTLNVTEDRQQGAFVAIMSFTYKDYSVREIPVSFCGRSPINPGDAKNAAAKQALDFLKHAMQFELIDYNYEELQRLKAVHANCANRQVDVGVALGFQGQITRLLTLNQQLHARIIQVQTQNSDLMRMSNDLKFSNVQLAAKLTVLEQEKSALVKEVQDLKWANSFASEFGSI